MPEDLAKELLIPSAESTRLETFSATQLRDEMQREFYGIPLSDTGAIRAYDWAALGIQWRVTCTNSYDTIGLVEQFVAVLQIALADLAQHDLCLLPTSVSIQAELTAIGGATLKIVPGNDTSGMKVTLPKMNAVSQAELWEMQREVCGIAIAVLTQCSCLSDKDLFRQLDGAFRNGLTSKVFIVRPYCELFAQFVDSAEYDNRRAASLVPPDADTYVIRSAPELAWLDAPGPGYTPKKAQIAIRNRYERSTRPIAITLARLRRIPRFQQWVAQHRVDGRKDWWILLVLMNTILNYRARLAFASNDVQGLRQYISKAMNDEESADAIEFPVEVLFSEEAKMSATSFMLTTAKTWNLAVRSHTPDTKAFDKLLGTRYGQATDDVDHIDPFSDDQPN
jgi:hypothetical protein